MRSMLVPAVIAASLLATSTALAGTVCVERSPDDALADNEWTAARALLVHSINRTDLTVVDAMCSRTWTVAHVSLGDTWTVLVRPTQRRVVRGLVDVTTTDSTRAEDSAGPRVNRVG